MSNFKATIAGINVAGISNKILQCVLVTPGVADQAIGGGGVRARALVDHR